VHGAQRSGTEFGRVRTGHFRYVPRFSRVFRYTNRYLSKMIYSILNMSESGGGEFRENVSQGRGKIVCKLDGRAQKRWFGEAEGGGGCRNIYFVKTLCP